MSINVTQFRCNFALFVADLAVAEFSAVNAKPLRDLLMNKAGIAAVAIVALAAAGSAGAWYTGTQLEGVLHKSIEQANQALTTQYPGSDLALEMVAFDRGLFSSKARYRVLLKEASTEDEDTFEVFVADEIQHGPVPLSRLVRFKWWPVMAVSHAQLESTGWLHGLFAASGGRPPLTVDSTFSYGKKVHGAVEVVPLSWSKEGAFSANFSGFSGQYETDRVGERILLDGRVDGVEVNVITAQVAGTLNLVGWDMQVNRKRDESGLYLGTSRGNVDQFSLTSAGTPALVMNDVVQSDLVSLEDNGVNVGLKYRIGAINYGADRLGSMDLGLTLSRINPQAVVELGRLYNGLVFSLGEGKPDQAQLDQFETLFKLLLDDHPRISLDNFVLKTANGESRLNLGVDLGLSAESTKALSEAEPEDVIQALDARLVLSKPMIRDVVRYRALFDPSVDQATVDQEAAMAAEMAGAMAEMFQLGRVEGDNIISQLSYANGAVTFNGQAMELAELMGLMAGMQ